MEGKWCVRNRLVPYFLRVAYKIFLCEGEGLFPLRAMEGI